MFGECFLGNGELRIECFEIFLVFFVFDERNAGLDLAFKLTNAIVGNFEPLLLFFVVFLEFIIEFFKNFVIGKRFFRRRSRHTIDKFRKIVYIDSSRHGSSRHIVFVYCG